MQTDKKIQPYIKLRDMKGYYTQTLLDEKTKHSRNMKVLFEVKCLPTFF